MARGLVLTVLWTLTSLSVALLVPHENFFPAQGFLEGKSYKAR
jgi:hypothetical protein